MVNVKITVDGKPVEIKGSRRDVVETAMEFIRYGSPSGKMDEDDVREIRDPSEGRATLSEDFSSTSRSKNQEKLLPTSRFIDEILNILSEAGGEAKATWVLNQLGDHLLAEFETAELQVDDSGVARWRRRAKSARESLVRQDLMDKNAPRGTWRLTEEGKQKVRQLSIGVEGGQGNGQHSI